MQCAKDKDPVLKSNELNVKREAQKYQSAMHMQLCDEFVMRSETRRRLPRFARERGN